MKSFKNFFNEGITPEPAGGWRVKPEMEKWLDERYQDIYDSWVPVKRALMTGEIPDYTVFKGKPAERKMDLQDIVPGRQRDTGLVDWIRGNLKQVITVAGNWVDNDVKSNSRLIFDPRTDANGWWEPVDKEQYQLALSKFRQRLVGFGKNPETMWHIIDSRNAREVALAIQKGIDELFDLTREIIHFNRPQDSQDKPDPTSQDPSDDPNQELY